MQKFVNYLFSTLFLIFHFNTYAQTVLFEHSNIEPSEDIGLGILEDANGNLISIASTTNNSNGLADFLITKMSANGTALWSLTHGGFNNDIPQAGVVLSDGSVVVVGFTASFSTSPSRDVYCIKVDSAGSLIWSRTFGGNSRDEGTDIKQTPDGGFIISGFTESYGSGSRDAWLIKTDSIGGVLWTQTFGGAQFDDAWAVDTTEDKGFILTGGTYSLASGTEDDLWLIKADSLGNQMWIENFGLTNIIDWGWDVAALSDGYVAVGLKNRDPNSLNNNPGEAQFIKTDLFGNLVWDKSISNNYYAEATCISPGLNGGWLIGGTKSSLLSDIPSFWVLKTDDQGDLLWEVELGQPNTLSRVNDVIQTMNGDVVAIGFSGFSSTSNQDLHLARISDLSLSNGNEKQFFNSNITVSAFPNPSKGQFILDFGEDNINGIIEVKNELGQIIWKKEVFGTSQINLDLSEQADGLYFLFLYSQGDLIVNKLIIQ